MALHADQFELSTDRVRQLITDQFPQWADRPISRIASHGTVHALFRIGPDLVARLALQPADPATRRAEIVTEHDAARRLLAVSPVPTPAPVAIGEPGADYPLPFSVQRWLPGRSLMINDPEAASTEFATDLAGFVAALRTLPWTCSRPGTSSPPTPVPPSAPPWSPARTRGSAVEAGRSRRRWGACGTTGRRTR